MTNEPTSEDIKMAHQPTNHHLHLHPGELGAALKLIRDSDIWWAVKYALIFLALTCVRSGDVRGATWEQMDLESEDRTWHIPQTKNGRAHDVPLSSQAVEILLHIQERTGSCEGLIFPSRRGNMPIGRTALSKTMDRLGIAASPHGFRSSFRNWAGRRADIAQPAAEMVLAHQQSDAVVAAYLTDTFIEERVPLMQEWADYVSETMGPVISPEDQGSEMKTGANA